MKTKLNKTPIVIIIAIQAAFMLLMTNSNAKPEKNMSGKDKHGILIVAFGTSSDSGKRAYHPFDEDIKKAYPNVPVYWAYTSFIIRKKLAKQGRVIDSVSEALEKMKNDNISNIGVQSLHVAPGEEYDEMVDDVRRFEMAHPGTFNSISVGRPLLESREDMMDVVKALLADLPGKRKKSEAVILMGHGQAHGRCDLTFFAVQSELRARDSGIFLASVEGGMTFDDMLKSVKRSGYKKAWLRPFMIVAGVHARDDLAGDDDKSWKTRLEKTGISCQSDLKGLGEMKSIRDIFVRHIKQVTESWKI